MTPKWHKGKLMTGHVIPYSVDMVPDREDGELLTEFDFCNFQAGRAGMVQGVKKLLGAGKSGTVMLRDPTSHVKVKITVEIRE